MPKLRARQRALALVAGAVMALVAIAAPASAATIEFGQVAPANPPALCQIHPVELLQSTTAEPNPYIVPKAGTIASWSTMAASPVGQQMGLKVYRPVPDLKKTYKVIGHDGPRALTPSQLNTFPTNIAVQAGDIIGLDDGNAGGATPNACIFTTASTDVFAATFSETADGDNVEIPPLMNGGRVNVAAVLQPLSTVTAVNPPAGSVQGGTLVTISGVSFESVTGVSFGSVPAAKFTLVSDHEISAISPASATPHTVDVTVSTAEGVTPVTAADQFTYQLAATDKVTYEVTGGQTTGDGSGASSRKDRRDGCVVPALKGKTLKAVGKALKSAHCRLGKVKGPKGKASTVTKQSPKAGKTLASGAKVNITIGAHRP